MIALTAEALCWGVATTPNRIVQAQPFFYQVVIHGHAESVRPKDSASIVSHPCSHFLLLKQEFY
jgi:hypothetical protein